MILEDATALLSIAYPRVADRLHPVLCEVWVVAVTCRMRWVRWYRTVLSTDLRAVA